MKKMLLLAGCMVTMFAACNKTDDNNDPNNNNNTQPENKELKACFSVNKTLVDSGEFVSFTNCSENAASYEWKFVTGPSSTEKNLADRQFNKRGTIPVKLIVRNADATKSDDTTINIVVGRHNLTRLTVKKFKAKTKDSNGNEIDWDTDGSAPDIYFSYGPSYDAFMYKTFVKENASGVYSINIDPNIIITDANNGDWVFRMYDDDNGTPQVMGTFSSVFPSRKVSSPIKISGASTDYDVDLEFTVIP